MAFSSKMNGVLDYIEAHLTAPIDVQQIADIAQCSYSNFQRIFLFTFDLTLAEYIRKRRLAKAALTLQKGQETILGVALDYQYESASSFARAFRAMHGVSPSQVKKQMVQLQAFPKLSFDYSTKDIAQIQYQVVTKEAFRLIGIKKELTTKNQQHLSELPQLKKAMIPAFKAHDSKKVYQVCANFREDLFDFYQGIISNHAPLDTTLQELIIPASKWAILSFSVKRPIDIQTVWKELLLGMFEASNYQPSGAPELEWCSAVKNAKNEYECDIHIPII